jgi:hypothetical protein
LQTSTQSYWTTDFKVTETDREYLYSIFLEEETPITTPELIRRLIAFRINNEYRKLERHRDKGNFFQPRNTYQVEQELIFPAFDFATGHIVGERPGRNPDYGEFVILEVEFEDGKRREIASQVAGYHKLNEDMDTMFDATPADPAETYQRYKRILTPIVVDALREDKDTIFIAKRWFLKSLLLEVNVGHLNLAEAVLDMSSGGPLKTSDIAAVVGFGQDANPILQQFSLDYGLSQDERFDEVGPAGEVLWFLKRMEPPEIQEPPGALRYTEIPYNPALIRDELLDLENDIDDELSANEFVDDEELSDEVTIILNYPHWRMGTLPLTQRSEHLFPIAYRTPRIRMSLVDAKTGKEMNGWVVRQNGYVYGLGDFYRQYHLPIGVRLLVRSDDDNPSRVIVDFVDYKPRNEWIWVARPEEDRLRFEEGQQSIGAQYDDLMILGINDPDALDALAKKKQRTALVTLMRDLIGELAQFSPQRHVHSKTIYSAVNMLRRCPPGPIFATLVNDPSFVRTGGPYWRLA